LLSDKYLVFFVAFSVQKDLFLDFFKVGSQAQLSLHFIFAAAFFQFLQSSLNEKPAKCGSAHIFFFCKGMQWLLLILQEKLQQTVKKTIAVKPIVLSALTDRNVGHGNICCCLHVDNTLGHVGIRPTTRATKYEIGTA